ncbi:hypothetical protein [Arthrobacter sp. MP_2.3]|uniref:hypothetical protein n=1 Tax=Arthrobacter sp. MP_2.3 TaxID=3349633 RepID=UPI0038D4FCEE
MESPSRVDWSTISEIRFNELAEMLIVEDRSRDGLVAQAINGRGGDGGIDIDVKVARTGQLTEILQLKWFPQGFSAKYADRKRQIEKSFKSALVHDPAVWTLVVPANLTIPERKKIYALKKDRKIHIKLIGVTELNLLLAKYPDIHDWAMRDIARELLSIVGRDTAILSRPGDLSAEAKRLQDRSNAISPNWGVNFSSIGGVVSEQLYAKHDKAMEREPLSLSLLTEFGPDDDELRREFEDGLDYGVTQQLVLQSHVISSFTKVGPEWFAGEVESGEVHILPADEAPRDMRINATSVDAEGKRLSSVSARKGKLVGGHVGATLEFSTPGGLTLRWRVPTDGSGEGSVRVDFMPKGHSALDVRKAMGFMATLHQATKFLVAVDGQVSELVLPEGPTPPVGDPATAELIDDLAVIEVKTGATFAFPEFLPPALDRVWARAVRRILEGGYVPLPNTEGFNVTLNGDHGEVIERVLLEGGAMVISSEDWTIELLDETVYVGYIAIYHAKIHVDNGEEHVAALRFGNGAGRRVYFRSEAGSPGVMYMPGHPDAKETVVPEPWALTGIREHASIQ